MEWFNWRNPEDKLPGDLEDRYRRQFLQADVNHAIVGMMLLAFPLVPFVYSDYVVFGIGTHFFTLAAMRGIVFLYTMALLIRLRKINDPMAYDLQMLVWGIISVSLILVVNITRPPDYIYYYIFDIINIFIIYLGIPNRLFFRTSLALLITAGNLLRCFFIRSSLDPFIFGIIIISLLLANIVGVVLSIRLYAYRRRQFLAQVEVEEIRDRFKELAATDSLTGIHNRRKFMELTENEMHRFIRYQNPFTCLMFDLDHFKEINDKCGHAAGDQVLKEFTCKVLSQVRESDIFGRLGGEEFGLILVETPLETARIIAERIRLAVSGINVSVKGKAINGITVSIGMTGTSEGDTSLECIIERADAALYRAKQQGRDRVEAQEN